MAEPAPKKKALNTSIEQVIEKGGTILKPSKSAFLERMNHSTILPETQSLDNSIITINESSVIKLPSSQQTITEEDEEILQEMAYRSKSANNRLDIASKFELTSAKRSKDGQPGNQT